MHVHECEVIDFQVYNSIMQLVVERRDEEILFLIQGVWSVEPISTAVAVSGHLWRIDAVSE